MPGLLEHVGVRQRDKPHWLAGGLASGHRPVTLVFRDTFGIHLHPVPERTGKGALSDGQAVLLDAPAGTRCRWRTSRLKTADGQLAAGAFLLWIPGRLPAETNGALDAGQEAAGVILSRLPGGMSREYLRAVATDITDEITGEAATVRSMAVLVAAGRPVGLAEENFIREFVEALP
jgi:hypothetical protein